MDSDFYKEASLRDVDKTDSWYFGEDDIWYKYEWVPEIKYKKEYVVYQATPRNTLWSYPNKSSGLFTLSLNEMRQLADDVGIPANEAFSVQVYPDFQDENVVYAKNTS